MFGRLEQSDMDLSVCYFDEQAGGVVICDYGKIWFAREVDKFQMVYERFKRIKILADSGMSTYKLIIPVYYEGSRKEKLSSFEANIWSKHDNVWKKENLDKQFIENEAVNDNYYSASINFTDLKKGDILEFEYEIISPFFMPVHGWQFQSELPTMLSFLEVRMIPFYEYTFIHQGKRPDIQSSFRDDAEHSIGKNSNGQYGNIKYNEMVYHFGMTELPAAIDREVRIDFQLSKIIDLNGVPLKVTDTWDRTIKELLTDDRFGDFINKSQSRADKLFDLESYKSFREAEKFYALIHNVKQSYSWNGVLGKYGPVSFNNFLETGSGNSGTINLFAVGVLRAAGITAFPIIVSSRESPVLGTDQPFLPAFDNVLIAAKINDSLYLADATEKYLQDDLIPLRVLNTKGMIVEKNAASWVNCDTQTESETHTKLVIDAREVNRPSLIDLTKTALGYDAFLIRKQLKDDKKAILDYFEAKEYVSAENLVNTRDFNRTDLPYEINIEVNVPLVSDGESITVYPFLKESISTNPINEYNQVNAVDFYYQSKKRFTLKL